ncbi:hypothetical protein ACMU_03895 [Actibacterium mucosum KCTC 23349]|uniref:Integrase catalytic domain-containing protein n=1 Tax=Actibacterium mucosum KCTC 23349 TaxID=1454373 RepID=A0A037ZGW3_9RHOB|nr:hypothetical protein ACMU_03895 [Actibacterium mucosum KCTC 23349]
MALLGTNNPRNSRRVWFATAIANRCASPFNALFRDELLNGELLHTLKEAQILIEQWRIHYNTIRPLGALGYCPPAPEGIVAMDQRPTMH